MQRIGFRSSRLSVLSNRHQPTWRRGPLTHAALLLSLSVNGLMGCSSEPETPAAGQAAAPGAAPAAAPGMAGAMPAGGMPGGAMPGGAPANAAQMAAMPAAGAGAIPMPNGATPGVAMTPEQMAQMQKGANAGVPMPGVSSTPMPGIASSTPMPGVGPTPMPPGAAIPMPGIGTTPMPGAIPGQPVANAVPGQPMPGAIPGQPTPGAIPGQPMPGAIPAGAAPGAIPGAGLPGAPGSGGMPQNPTAQAGTAEYSAQKVVLQLLSGDVSGLEEFISPKCKGLLADVRDGKATDQQKDELKKLFAGLQGAGKPRVESGAKVITVRNAEGATITFKVKKEGESHKLIEMTVKQATTKKR